MASTVPDPRVERSKAAVLAETHRQLTRNGLSGVSIYDVSRNSGVAKTSDIDMGLPLRYEVTRKFAPYVGLANQQFFAGTIGREREAHHATSDLRLLVGIRLPK